ncbi:MAG: ACT domain-containing protein, partial [Alphaproteobacteria bacterium]|nr:ACT domain-containing protein [Alphaproteobacteria bacterium]
MILTLSCADRPGIVACVASFLFDRGGNIIDAQQFGDVETDRFFMRVVFEAGDTSAEALRDAFAPIGVEFGMNWTLRDPKVRRKVMILASQADHCLSDLVWRWRRGELPMEICAVVSNHPADTYSSIDLSGLPFHHLPVNRDTKLEQEAAVWSLVQSTGAELVVLARYMQVLSDGLATKLEGRCINI